MPLPQRASLMALWGKVVRTLSGMPQDRRIVGCPTYKLQSDAYLFPELWGRKECTGDRANCARILFYHYRDIDKLVRGLVAREAMPCFRLDCPEIWRYESLQESRTQGPLNSRGGQPGCILLSSRAVHWDQRAWTRSLSCLQHGRCLSFLASLML